MPGRSCGGSPAVSMFSILLAAAGLYFVWVPAHSTYLAELVGIGRGADLILYVWVCISLILLLNLHLKLRMQMELITMLARKLAVIDASPTKSVACRRVDPAHNQSDSVDEGS